MTTSQNSSSRASEIRTRLNELSGLEGDGLTEELRNEIGTLTTEYRDVETRLQVAIVAEDEDRKKVETRDGTDDDAETRELRSLQGRISLGAYLQPRWTPKSGQ